VHNPGVTTKNRRGVATIKNGLVSIETRPSQFISTIRPAAYGWRSM
jgi:hypothetical protein